VAGARARLYADPTIMFRDNTEKNRYELEVPGGVAFATYQKAPGVVTVLHTEVPEALSGKGLGSELARNLLDAIRERGEQVVPRCKFLAAFIGKHPEYRDLVRQ
jgi:predicted GNAT family acetyltransferase